MMVIPIGTNETGTANKAGYWRPGRTVSLPLQIRVPWMCRGVRKAV